MDVKYGNTAWTVFILHVIQFSDRSLWSRSKPSC